MTARLEVVGQPAKLVVGVVGQGQEHEIAVVTVGVGPGDRLADDRNDPLAGLAGALGDELLDPIAEGGQPRRGQDGELVAPGDRGLADGCPKRETGVRGRVSSAACVRHGPGASQQPRKVDAVQRGRNEAEDRQRGVAAADVGWCLDDGAKLLRLRQVHQGRARIGDGDEVERGCNLAHRRLIGIRFGGRSRLRGDAEQRALLRRPRTKAADRVGMRRVTDPQLQPVG